MTCRVSFRVRRPYFDAIVRGEKTVEVRAKKTHWVLTGNRLLRRHKTTGWTQGDFGVRFMGGWLDDLPVAVFVCGKGVHRRSIVCMAEYPTAEAALGGPPGEQGRADIGEGRVIGFHLGEIWRVR